MEVESITWLPGAGFTQRGLWRVLYKNADGQRFYRHYAHWKGSDELAIYTKFIEENKYT